MTTIDINGERLLEDLAALARIGTTARGGVSRPAFSTAELAARAWLRGRAEEAGLRLTIDGIGNTFIDLPESHDYLGEPAVWSGSHIDSVPDGGRFDGTVGVIAALETLRRVRETNQRLARPIRAVAFTDEEGSYAHLLGSSAVTRGFTPEELDAMRSREGHALARGLEAIGSDTKHASDARVEASDIHACVELHIEQGPELEASRHHVGVVTDIVGVGGGSLTFRGRADHAGTTPMGMRRDALGAAAEFIHRLPSLVEGDSVATCGRIDVLPGSSNVVVEEASLTLDFRDSDCEELQLLQERIVGEATRIAHTHSVHLRVDLEALHQPAAMDHGLRRLIETAATRRGLRHMPMRSGAIHDSLNLSTIAPTAMIFVPSVDGRSHCPEESTTSVDLVNGASILADVLVELATSENSL